MDEKRKFSRVPFAIGTFFTYRDQPYQGEIHNLSLKGMFVKTNAPVNVAEVIPFTIRLAGDTSELSLHIKGVVIRKIGDGLGIRFSQIDLESFIHLKNIVKYNSQNADQIEEEFLDYIKGNIREGQHPDQDSGLRRP